MSSKWIRIPECIFTLEKGKAIHARILAWRILWTVHGIALPDFVAGDTTESSVGFGLQVLKQKQKGSIFVLSDELKDSHLHALAIKNIMMMIATDFH